MELLAQLETAEKMLQQLQKELQEQRNDLMQLSSERDALQTSLRKLKLQIDKERRVHRRQVWQKGCGAFW